MRRPGRRVGGFAIAVALVPWAPATATHVGGYPHCVSRVGVAAAGSYLAGEVKIHGYGGGRLGALAFPGIVGVTPSPTPAEGDMIGALLELHMIGVLGGGTTQVRWPSGLVGTPAVRAGAQVLTVSAFTGHYRFVSRTYVCESVVRASTLIRWEYVEFTFSGLLTPVNAGSPLREWGDGFDIEVKPGDNASY